MPLIGVLNGMKIYVYYGDHLPPHIHVYYNEYHMIIVIESGKQYSGRLPVNKYKKINKWLYKNADWIKEAFYRFNPGLS